MSVRIAILDRNCLISAALSVLLAEKAACNVVDCRKGIANIDVDALRHARLDAILVDQELLSNSPPNATRLADIAPILELVAMPCSNCPSRFAATSGRTGWNAPAASAKPCDVSRRTLPGQCWNLVSKRSDASVLFTALAKTVARIPFVDPRVSACLEFPPNSGPLGPAHRSTSTLTRRESAVADAICLGLSNKEIAQKLGIAPPTVRNHVSAMMARLGVKCRTQIALHYASGSPTFADRSSDF